jgi:hypothetical protein
MGLYKADSGIFLAEWKGGKWVKYTDYALAIPEKDLWFAAPKDNNVIQLSSQYKNYDFIANSGRQNIGSWIENAAKLAGR